MSTVLCHCLAQMVLWVGIKGTLLYMYASNPGPEGFEWYHANTSISHFSTNLAFLSDLRNYPFFLSNIAFIWLPVLFFHRLIRDNFARRSLLVVIPFFAGMMLVGNIYEIRIWGELIPVFLPGFSLVVMALFDNSENRLDNPSWQMPGNPPV